MLEKTRGTAVTSDVVWGMAQEERMKGLVQGLGWKESRVAKASQTQPGLELPFELFVRCGVSCFPMPGHSFGFGNAFSRLPF